MKRASGQNALAMKSLAKHHADTPEAQIAALVAENDYLREVAEQYRETAERALRAAVRHGV